MLVKPFDEIAAIELAAIEHEARGKGDKRGGSAAPWTKVKFDRQIVAIAKAHGATRFYSDDEDVIKFGTKAGLEVISTWNLPLPAAKQTKIDFEEPIRSIQLDGEEGDAQQTEQCSEAQGEPARGAQTPEAKEPKESKKWLYSTICW